MRKNSQVERALQKVVSVLDSYDTFLSVESGVDMFLVGIYARMLGVDLDSYLSLGDRDRRTLVRHRLPTRRTF
tara:strand:+ start:501 stop:719 length:219 start_codon:yes stop_codon:yes gene_type:complete